MGSPFHDPEREGREISLAFSPCPNDTFMMDALVNRKLPSGPDLKVHLMDIQQLNQAAVAATFDVTKISVAAYPLVSDQYELLDAGAAMGFGCGPLVVAKTALKEKDLDRLKIAIPGRHTTANYLFHHFFPSAGQPFFTVFSEIENLVLSGEAGAGVIIHESRFTYRQKGLFCVADLGALWEERYHLPLPLGIFVCRRSLDPGLKENMNHLIRDSIRYAFDHPASPSAYVLNHAREMEPEVVKQHIGLYVNEYSLSMGTAGRAAIDFLIQSENLIHK
ncbi:MAG TPA: 1,4-dihydroxy-6-naphthoate synthase [Saprospiraceae bacterium]|nr:1,4-dihydroxy-6-naphthoate synthase [Saprospiraceae bacterium]HNT20202.1 1,4-dihydroxy-6-naphthoate synthase [Saprospiraceae bacterium]